MAIRVACASITWNAWPDYTYDQVLAEIAASDYAGAPVGFPAFDDKGQPAISAAAMLSQYAAHGLQPAPGYLSGHLWEVERRAELVAAAAWRAHYSRALGLTDLYVSASCTEALFAVSGLASGRRAIGLDDAGLAIMATTLNAMGATTSAEGVNLCYHNHAGSYIETEAEYEALIERLDPALVQLGPDTGHLAIGGGDNAAFFARHASRIRTVHFKDIDGAVLRAGQRERSGYRAMVAAGLFAELGAGMIDFAPLLASLTGAGFHGWLIAETDQTMLSSARQSAEISRSYLRSLGV